MHSSAPHGGCFYFILFVKTKHERNKNMKKKIKSTLSVILSLVFIFCLVSCSNTVDEKGLWENAIYLNDTEFGSGEKTVQVEVTAEDRSVTFTVNTDKDILGDALLEHGLIAGEEGPYGLYIKVVNGITADYDINQSYWSLCKNGEYMTVGADGAEITNGEHYEFIYTE